MRFLIGILTGGALTWAAISMLGDALPSPGPAFRWLDEQMASEGIVERIRGAAVAADTDDERSSERVSIPEQQPPPRDQAPVREPEAPARESPPAYAQRPDQTPIAPVRGDEPPPSTPMPTISEAPLADTVDEPAVVIAPEPNGWESAWVPFQTQRSALGFAHVLTRQVQHPFEVRREASQRYRVTFAYADQAERERVLAAVRSLTGTGP